MSIDLRSYKLPKTNKIEATKSKASIFDFLNKEITLFGNSFNAKKKESFYSELHVLLKAGVDLKTTLDIVEEEQKNKRR